MNEKLEETTIAKIFDVLHDDHYYQLLVRRDMDDDGGPTLVVTVRSRGGVQLVVGFGGYTEDNRDAQFLTFDQDKADSLGPRLIAQAEAATVYE